MDYNNSRCCVYGNLCVQYKHRECVVTYKSRLFNSVFNIGQSSGRFDKNQDENFALDPRPRIAKLYDKQSNAISRNKDNCFGNISVLKRKPI